MSPPLSSVGSNLESKRTKLLEGVFGLIKRDPVSGLSPVDIRQTYPVSNLLPEVLCPFRNPTALELFDLKVMETAALEFLHFNGREIPFDQLSWHFVALYQFVVFGS
jgi:hypothetical protein